MLKKKNVKFVKHSTHILRLVCLALDKGKQWYTLWCTCGFINKIINTYIHSISCTEFYTTLVVLSSCTCWTSETRYFFSIQLLTIKFVICYDCFDSVWKKFKWLHIWRRMFTDCIRFVYLWENKENRSFLVAIILRVLRAWKFVDWDFM